MPPSTHIEGGTTPHRPVWAALADREASANIVPTAHPELPRVSADLSFQVWDPSNRVWRR